MDSDEETIGNDDYDSSELETEDDDVSQNTQSATDTSDGVLLVTQLHFTCTLPVEYKRPFGVLWELLRHLLCGI